MAAWQSRNRWGAAIRCLLCWVWPVLLAVALAGCGGEESPTSSRDATTSTPAPTPSPTPTETPTKTPKTAGIPDDFPLAQGLAADGETKVSTPQRSGNGVSLQQRCWGEVWPGAAKDRLVVHQVGPELGVTRELVVYRDAATARAVGEQVRVRATRCHRLPATPHRGAMDVTLQGSAHPHTTTVFAETLHGGRPGGAVFAFTRVGRAVLAVEDGGEWTRESAVAGARALERSGRDVVARMCMFTEAVC
ncbi:hypothetical protein [Marmoricola sp. URHB0036]|uniref:hypothetical protein n=1 Tax=Marmoricola sp. URHB0036 TaxID=1298863 RepID=UPI0012DCF469|nr:hypothetical protein [Marmoricola sp. URHB0036]